MWLFGRKGQSKAATQGPPKTLEELIVDDADALGVRVLRAEHVERVVKFARRHLKGMEKAGGPSLPEREVRRMVMDVLAVYSGLKMRPDGSPKTKAWTLAPGLDPF